jgi:hypothetical protein
MSCFAKKVHQKILFSRFLVSPKPEKLIRKKLAPEPIKTPQISIKTYQRFETFGRAPAFGGVVLSAQMFFCGTPRSRKFEFLRHKKT